MKKPIKRPTLGQNPLEAIAPPAWTRTAPAPPPVARLKKVRATFRLSERLFDEARDRLAALLDPPELFRRIM
jgi:hypothetical protein